MKIIFTLAIFLATLSCSSPGTLGSAATRDLNCSVGDVNSELDELLELNQFKIASRDTSATSLLKEGGMDFLDYRCLNIQKRMYMITINSDDLQTSTISVRSVYDRGKKEWIAAKEFKAEQEDQAENAMDYLVRHLRFCSSN